MNKLVQRLSSFLLATLKAIPVILGLVGLTFVIAWISGVFTEKIQPGESRPIVLRLDGQATDIVHELIKEYTEESVGTLKAANRSVISSKVLATIQEIHVAAGDLVKQGDLLITLNSQALDARRNQVLESLAGVRASVGEAENDFQRIRRLLESNAVSRQEYDLAERKLRVAQAEERRARQAVTEAEVVLSYSKITAPKAGRIVDRTAEPGDTALPGKPVLALYDAHSLRLEAPVMERLAVGLKVGQTLTVRVDSLDQEFIATIDEVVPQADSASRSFLVKASLPLDDNLYEGMFGRLRIPAGSRRHLCLATDAVRRVGQLEFVDVVMADDSIQRRLIKTGRLGMPGRVEVLSGVNQGDRVVLNPSAAGRLDSPSDAKVQH